MDFWDEKSKAKNWQLLIRAFTAIKLFWKPFPSAFFPSPKGAVGLYLPSHFQHTLMRSRHARKEGADNQKARNSRKETSGRLICMSIHWRRCRQRAAGSYGAGGLFSLSPQPCMSLANRGSELGSRVLCCDRCKFQGSLGSYITGFTNSEPVTFISFSQQSIWGIDEKKNMQSLLRFFFFETDTFCVLFSLLSQRRH